MECTEAQSLLPPYGDQQAMDAAQRAALQAHVQHCASCQTTLRKQASLSGALRTQADYFRMPAGLRVRLRASLPREPYARAPGPRSIWFRSFGYGATLAAGAALALLVQFYSAGFSVGLGANDRLLDEVVAGHVRSLMAGHLADVASSDRHTVKPWFAGKLDFSPPVLDLSAQGFPLTGGRLDYIGSHNAAALIYRHREHTINLFVWPTADSGAVNPESRSLKGYSVVHWQIKGMSFWAVSDLNPVELKIFAQTLADIAI